jgi:hypothetical protein
VTGSGPAVAAPATLATDPLTWLTTNAGWLAAGVVGFFLLREVL